MCARWGETSADRVERPNVERSASAASAPRRGLSEAPRAGGESADSIAASELKRRGPDARFATGSDSVRCTIACAARGCVGASANARRAASYARTACEPG